MSQTRAADKRRLFGRNLKVPSTHNLVPPKPEVTINVDSLVLNLTLEAIKVKGVLCEK